MESKSYRFKEYSLVVIPDKDNYNIWFPSTIKVFNYQLLLNDDNEFFVNYWVIGSYIDRCFLRTGYITKDKLLEFWERQSDKDDKLTKIFFEFINS